MLTLNASSNSELGKSLKPEIVRVEITEQKVKIGDFDINYVRSSIDGGNPSKTLVCIPGAMGKLQKLHQDHKKIVKSSRIMDH